jgi:hypothetical protein
VSSPPTWFYSFVAVFVVIMAVALALQLAMLTGLLLAFRRLQKRIDQVLDKKVEPLLDGAKSVLADAQYIVEQARGETERLAFTFEKAQETFRAQLAKVDLLLTEATDRARLEIIRIDELVADTIQRVEQTTEFIQKSVVRPVREMQAAVHGILSAVQFLLNRRSPRNPQAPERATQDEELFI